MLGLMILTWAWAENTLAMIVGIINENAEPIKGHPEAPLSLKRRIKYFKDALRDVAALKTLQQDGRSLTVRFVELGARRNNFVHGAPWQIENGGFESFGLAVERGNYTVKNHRFNIGDAVLLNGEIAKLQNDAAAFLLKMVAIFES